MICPMYFENAADDSSIRDAYCRSKKCSVEIDRCSHFLWKKKREEKSNTNSIIYA